MGAQNGTACSVHLIDLDDWQDWRRLRQEALREAPYAFGSSLASWTGEGDTEERWRNRLRDVPVNFVATLDGLDVGMCSLTAIVDEETDLIAMWVAPEARGRGVGRSLVRAAVDQARANGATKVLLDVVEENQSAIALYSTCGFVDVGSATGSTPDRPDRRMRLDLWRPTRPASTDMLAGLVIRDGRPGEVETMAWARSEDQRDAWRQQSNRASVGEVCFIVAEIEGRAIGKAVLDWTHNADGTPWLWMVSVDPDYRSQGIGTGMLAVAEARAQERGHASIEMAVDDDNTRARDLYLRNGYAVVGPHVDEYDVIAPDGGIRHAATPGVLLRKTLTRELPSLTLTGALVTLAPLALDHVPDLVDAAIEDRSSFTFTRVPVDVAGMTTHVKVLLDEQRAGATVPFAILDPDSGRVLGMTRYLGLDYWSGSATPSVAEIGSSWLRRSAQGTGVNREAKHLMLDHAFRVWGVHRVSFQTDARNDRSRRAIEALGAMFEGIQRAHKRAADGGIRDTAWYSILAPEWLSTDESALVDR